MVVKLKLASPAKFYGSSLPRPRIYTDVKFNTERVDPPVPVLDPLLNWANEAHWSMGGLSFTRLRHQGSVEGNVAKLCAERDYMSDKKKNNKSLSPDSAPAAPMETKKRRFMALMDDDEEEEEEDNVIKKGRRRLVKKLADEFDRVADVPVASRTRSGRKFEVEEDETLMQVVVKDVKKFTLKSNKKKKLHNKGVRTSPRLANKT